MLNKDDSMGRWIREQHLGTEELLFCLKLWTVLRNGWWIDINISMLRIYIYPSKSAVVKD
jgi:hypothetical protein